MDRWMGRSAGDGRKRWEEEEEEEIGAAAGIKR